MNVFLKESEAMSKSFAQKEIDQFMNGVIRRNPGENEFHQAVMEVVSTLMPFVLEHPRYREARILERMTEPDRIVIFRVCWEDDRGNVRAEKALTLGAKVVTLSDSSGYIHIPDGLDIEQLDFIRELKEVRRGTIYQAADQFKKITFHAKERPWAVPVDIAMPCATQNEINGEEAVNPLKNGVKAICEGANMPADLDAVHAFVGAKVLYGPGKAANAGGVAVSGLEQSQNAVRLSWSRNEVDSRLQSIMHEIHKKCVDYGAEPDHVNYVKGANIGGFVKVAEAMLAYGIM